MSSNNNDGDKKPCNSRACASHMYIVEAVKELKEMNQLLLEGQRQLERVTIKLVESMKSVDRLHTKVDKIEAHQETVDKDQDGKIDNLRVFMWRTLGLAGSVPICAVVGRMMGWF